MTDFLVHSEKIAERYFCVRFSPLGDGQRGILGSARIQSLQPLHALPSSVVQAACDGCFTRSVSQSVCVSVQLFPGLGHVLDSTSAGVIGVDIWTHSSLI